MNDDPQTGDTSHLPHAEIPGCALVQDLLPLYIDGEVSPESHALIAEHLERCERCSGFLAGARSVRTQILDEQKQVRAAFAYAPAVAAVQQPMWSSPLATLWRFAMLLVWLGSLAVTFMGVVDGAPQGVVIGGFGTVAAIGGLMIAGGEQRPEWRLGMLLTGLLGAFCVASAMLWFSYQTDGALLLGGLMQLAIAAWGLWPRRPRVLAQPVAEHKGSEQPMLTALISLAAAALCVGLIVAGLGLLGSAQSSGPIPAVEAAPGLPSVAAIPPLGMDRKAPGFEFEAVPPEMAIDKAKELAMADAMKAEQDVSAKHKLEMYLAEEAMRGGPSWESQVISAALIAAGVAGLVVIAGRRGWLPPELKHLTPRQWLGYVLVSGGLIWLSIVLRALLVGLLPSLPAVGISAALVLLGWALARRPPPSDETRVL